jgi:hypothetical protein
LSHSQDPSHPLSDIGGRFDQTPQFADPNDDPDQTQPIQKPLRRLEDL